MDKEDYEKATSYLKKALMIEKDYPLALVSLGNVLFESGNPETALKYH